MSMDPSGSKRLDEVEQMLKALVSAITRLELVGSQRLDILEAEAFDRFNILERKLDTLGEALVTLIHRLDPEGKP